MDLVSHRARSIMGIGKSTELPSLLVARWIFFLVVLYRATQYRDRSLLLAKGNTGVVVAVRSPKSHG